jgi:peroxiredoxin
LIKDGALRGIVRVAGLLILLAMALMACGGPEAGVRTGISEGQHAPNFSLETLDGKKTSLSDYQGQVVLLNFWATWCAPCREEIPAIEAVLEARQGEPFVVLGVNYQEGGEKTRAFVEELGMTYPVLLDETGKVMQTYRAPGLPMSILLDQEGVIQKRHPGLLTEAKLDEYLAELLP